MDILWSISWAWRFGLECVGFMWQDYEAHDNGSGDGGNDENEAEDERNASQSVIGAGSETRQLTSRVKICKCKW